MSHIDNIVKFALSLEGLDGGNPDHRSMWEYVLGQPPAGSQWDLKKTWTCGLVAGGILRHVGVDLPCLYKPYKIGTAISRLVSGAQRAGCWQNTAHGLSPEVGDLVIIGTGASTHALTIVDIDGDVVTSIDGGQVSKKTGYQMISKRKRILHSVSGKHLLDSRAIWGWCKGKGWTIPWDGQNVATRHA